MVKAVILIGGPLKGTRFRPLSFEIPKPLFPVAGKPVVQHLIEACSKVEGLTDIYLMGFYQQDNILNQFVRDMSTHYQTNVRYLQEYESLGTCGGIYHFRDQICRNNNGEAFFVLNGDICGDFNLNEMFEFHRKLIREKKNPLMTLLTTEVAKEQSLSYGCVARERETQRVLHYVEKPSTFISSTINCGIYLCSLALFKFISILISEKEKLSSEEGNLDEDGFVDCVDKNGNQGEWLSIEKDIIPALVSTEQIYAFHSEKWWSQLKNAASAIYANRHYLKLISSNTKNDEKNDQLINNVAIDETANIHPTAKIGPNVTIGAGAVISAGVRIKESIILRDAIIKEHSLILHSIVGWNSVIGPWSRIEGTPSDPNPNNAFAKVDNKALFNADGKLLPSITVLGSNVQVPSETIILNSIVLPHKELGRNLKNEIIL